MFTILDRYIARLFFIYFLAGIVVFVTLFLSVDFMSFSVKFNAPLSILLKYYTYQVPITVYQMIPVACLVATVFTLSTLNKTGELVAMFASGISLARICVPMLVVVALLSTFSFWLSDQVLPRMFQLKNYVYYVEIKEKPGLYSTVKTNKIWYRSDNVLFNIKTLNASEKKAQGLTLYYFDPDWNLVQLVTANDVSIKKRDWALANGTVTLFTEETSFPLSKPFRTKVIKMKEDMSDVQKSGQAADSLTVTQLKKFISRNKDAGLDTVQYEVDFHSKFSFAFAAFVMALMGIPFSVQRQRSGGMVLSAGMCMGLTFFYWALYSSSLTMGKHGALPPIVAAWAANFIIMATSAYLLVRLKK